MVIEFDKTLEEALNDIGFNHKRDKQVGYIVCEKEDQSRALYNHNGCLTHLGSKYEMIKKKIIDTIKNKLNEQQDQKEIENIILETNEFILKAGDNCIRRSEFGGVYKYHLWVSNKGFIVGVEQKGTGFDAVKVNDKHKKSNKGWGFKLYRGIDSGVFFDKPEDARIVYMKYMV